MPEPDGTNDRTTLTLAALRRDVEHVPLPDPVTVRRRGEARSRRQALAGALAVLALVAIAIGRSAGLGGPDRATVIPAPQPTPRAEAPLRLAADPLLPPAELAGIGPYAGWRTTGADTALSQLRQRCVGDLTRLDPTAISGLFTSDLDAQALETAVAFPDEAAATAALAASAARLRECPPGSSTDATVTDRAESVPGVGTAAVRLSRLTVPTADADPAYYELALARRGNLLVALQWRSMGNPFGGTGDSVTAGWVWTADRLRRALDQATDPGVSAPS